MRIFLLSLFVFLVSIHSVIFPQEPNKKVYATIALSGLFATDSTLGASGFNAAPEGNVLKFAIKYKSNRFSVGPALGVGFNAAQGADSLKFTEIGIEFAWMLLPNFDVYVNPAYALWERAGANTWLNVSGGGKWWFEPDLAALKFGFYSVDGKGLAEIGLVFKIHKP